MAHFAEIRKDNNVVLRVIVVNNEDVNNNGGDLSTQAEIWVANNHPNDELIKEELGGVYPETYWKQTSYNNNFRKQYGGPKFTYDKINDVFISPKPFPSWTLNSDFNWEAPFPVPSMIYGALAWSEELQTYITGESPDSEIIPRTRKKWNRDTNSFVDI